MAILDILSFQNKIAPILQDAILNFSYEAGTEIKLNMKLASLSDKKKKNPDVGIGSLRVITGNLARSFDKNAKGNIFEVKKSQNDIELNYGSNLPYALIHEFGGKANLAILPKRPYFYDGINKWKKKYQKKMELKLKIAITDELKIWLENQRQ
jgi:phage gpG-like protein